jgi:hypothetical protein
MPPSAENGVAIEYIADCARCIRAGRVFDADFGVVVRKSAA